MLTRGDIHDPGIGFITLTRVVVTADLQLARIYYTSLGDEKARKETAKALQRATPYLRRQVGGLLRLRRVPEFEFRFDQAIEHQDRIERIIRDLHDNPPEPIDFAQGKPVDSAPGQPLETAQDKPQTSDDDHHD